MKCGTLGEITMLKLRSAMLLTLILLPISSLATNLTPSQVLYNTQQLNGQSVNVIGVVTFLKAAVSPDGTAYQTFKLCDANACLSVVSTTKDTYTEGKQLTAAGVFWAVWHQGTIARFNELVISNSSQN